MTPTEFLLDRIAEDERHAHKLAEVDRRPVLSVATTINHPQRFLAEIEAKRRIVEMQAANDEDRYLPGFHYKAQMIERVLRLLALPYADHPDFREEWRP